MENTHREILYYKTLNGEEPFTVWFNDIRDNVIKRAVRARLKRVENGNLGDCKSLGDDVYELRFLGLGIRVYFAAVGNVVILLLCGGSKNTAGEQSRDIARAKQYWQDFRGRAAGEENEQGQK